LSRFRREILAVHENVGQTGASLALAVMRAIETPSAPPLQLLETPDFIDPMLET
jgi:hypothetical protein